MDYEKKYKEALEDMRVIYPNLKGDAKLAVEHAFPELAESEDERVRKWIYSLVENLGYPADEDAEKELEEMQPLALAYLEKQKEPEPAEWSEKDEKMRYFVTEAVQFRYSDRELAKYLEPKIINEKKQLKQTLFDWLRDLRPSWKPSDK